MGKNTISKQVDSAERAAKEQLGTISHFVEDKENVKWDTRAVMDILHTIILLLLLILKRSESNN